MSNRVSRARACATASMGPRSCERGNDARSVHVMLVESLQWGRARASAEMPDRADALFGAMARFNGAALVRARKFDKIIYRESEAYDGFNGAALVRARKSPDPPIVTGARLASMGPRSCERGNQARTKEGAKKIELQWGRARASAEIVFRLSDIIRYRMLQWGRARASAEMDT